jgi:TP53 regulating kinase-like protein
MKSRFVGDKLHFVGDKLHFVGDKLHFVGAEAVISIESGRVKKNRVRKGYRIPEIDEPIRSKRTKNEVRVINKAGRSGVNVPKIISSSEYDIEMEFIDGEVVRDFLNRSDNFDNVCRKIGEGITKLHENDIVHGDLTTSNMILKGGEIYFIDFGLSEVSSKIEDKAVDIHLIKEALEAKHTKKWKTIFNGILKHYNPSNREEIIQRMKQIEKRGRYSKKE